ncbi:MAG: peroxiredoxin [Candidatus Gracilibacteria bacterium]|nr:peroxiredoxin [Candidatus Gracilibacteria bacterium]
MNLDLTQRFEAISYNLETGIFSIGELLNFSKKTILYFYPKDDTPGCTIENKDFSCLKNDFSKLGIVVIGVSKDLISSHKKFIENQGLKVDLISDPELVLHKYFGAYGEKNNYGRIITGVIRSTFLLDNEGNILKSWKKVKAKNHPEKILKELSN